MPRSRRLRKTTVLAMVAHTPKRSAPRYRTASGSETKVKSEDRTRAAAPEETAVAMRPPRDWCQPANIRPVPRPPRGCNPAAAGVDRRRKDVVTPAAEQDGGEAPAPLPPPARPRLAECNEALPTGRRWYILQDPSPAAAPDGARSKEQSAPDCWRD